MFKPVSAVVDFPALEEETLKFWEKEKILEKYLIKNKSSMKKFSFIDGPKTANNPLGVHHAWGRTYKDLWQRFFNMKGFKQRFQNGYDEQGLWVEVEVEKNLGLKSKKDIENIVSGDKIASLEKFINLCKDRIDEYGDVITKQSIRLGQFMDWDNNYRTSSDQNNYLIWHFLKDVDQKGWLYKGHDSVPWCPRCGTAISQHEILTEDYQEVTHDSIYFELPIEGKENEFLLVWTTTPWTLPANIAVAVDSDLEYSLVEGRTGGKFWLASDLVEKIFKENYEITKTVKGKELIGLKYKWAFDNLPRVMEVAKKNQDKFHMVIATNPQIMPISATDGTGLVHTAVSAGVEDFQLGKELGLPMIEVIDEEAGYLEGLGKFSGLNAKKNPKIILDYLVEEDKHGNNWVFEIIPYKHRYPACWRCKTELVWRVVDEWYIAVDKEDPESKETFRQKMIKVAKEMAWQPKFVEKRELDWLENLHDWLISKKRYWGLAIPIWECTKCKKFEVVGGFNELKEKAAEGWDKFEGHSPHRPWIDQIKLKCSECGSLMNRIPDVGNPWLDAGIVPYSTITEKAGEVPSYITDKKYWDEWFPPDFAVEMYEQTRLWFYAMIAMSADLEGKPPVKRIFGHGRVVDEKGQEMHNSKGNAISLDEAFEKVGSDAMRWLYLVANPGVDLRFGYNLINDVRKRFILILWNSYKFFVDYASVSKWTCELKRGEQNILDKWILARLTELVQSVNGSLDKYDASSAARVIEEFVVNDFSTWYIRRSRDRVGPEAPELDRNTCLSVMYEVLVTLTKLLAPFIPFVTEEMYRNLTSDVSIHLTDYPLGDKGLLDEDLVREMGVIREIAEKAHAKRKEAEIKLRQPLAKLIYKFNKQIGPELEAILAEELNVKKVEYQKSSSGELEVKLDTNITPELREEGEARDLMREIQKLRKEQNYTLADRTKIAAPSWPERFEKEILKQTASVSLEKGTELKVTKV